MAEYIEREAVLDSLRDLSVGLKDILKGLKYIEETQICNAEISTVYECAMRVKEQPTADVVPVVRCGECENYNTFGCADGFGWCENFNNGVTDEHYCSYGERRCSDG